MPCGREASQTARQQHPRLPGRRVWLALGAPVEAGAPKNGFGSG